jgi:superoxide dismutase, Cu-Zn family
MTDFPTPRLLSLMGGACACLLSACISTPPAPSATAKLSATRGQAVSGEVHFTQQGRQVHMVALVSGLKPNAAHGFHIHEKGDCSSGDGMSTGGHFNPDAHAHGQQGHGAHHAGDLNSLQADAQGVARLDVTLVGVSVGSGAANDVVQRGLIVHRDPDDYTTQPTGNAGPRLACAVITRD